MAHIRENCKNMSTTYSAPENVFTQIDDYRFSKRKRTNSEAITELILKGLRYEALMEKKRNRERMPG